MGVYAVISSLPSPELKNRIVSNYPESHYEHGSSCFFVVDSETTQGVSAKLLLGEGVSGVVVLSVPGVYWGHASNALWEWLKTSIEADRNG